MTQISIAAILAAGMGTRLGEIGQEMPKGFLRLGAQPIIAESIDRLLDCGIRRIVIVTGYLSTYYERLQEQDGASIMTVHNPCYAQSGSMYSLYCARELLQDDFLLLESDLIYEPRALDAVIASPMDNAVLLSGLTGAGDEVYAETEGDRLMGLSKNRAALRNIAGELVGISKISRGLFECMLVYAEQAFRTSIQVAYETDTLDAVARSQPVYYAVVADLHWAEIDDPQHLARAREQIYPTIMQGRTGLQPTDRAKLDSNSHQEEPRHEQAGDKS